jgi:fumarate reductase subunit D
MKDDCGRIVARIAEAHETNVQRKKENNARTLKGWALMAAGWMVLALFAYVAVLEMCSLGPVGTAIREHLLPRLQTQAGLVSAPCT